MNPRENRYAPPTAQVGDVHRTDASPALWNPNAAANWSLLLSPAFGAYLHMRNWQALGDAAKAAASKSWVIATIITFTIAFLVGVVWPDWKPADGLSRAVGIGLLMAWYVASAREQARIVKVRFGSAYPRRGWLKPLALGLAAMLLFIAFMVLIAVGVERVLAR